MTNQDNHPMDPSNLHQKSEELAMEWTAGTSEDSADLSPEEMRKTIHELRLQQIELERQNEALRTDQTQIESERKYKTLFREMLDGFALHELICDEQGNPVDYRFLDVNPAFERMTGLKAGAILGRTVLEVVPGTEKHWIATYGKVALTGEPVFFENYSAELGKHFEVKAFRPFDGQFICIIQDITERKRAEEALRESQELLNTTQRLSKTGGWEWSTVTQTMFWTEETYRIHGFMPEEMEPGSAEHINGSLACYEPEARPIILGAFQRCVEQGEPYDLELPFTSAKGFQLWVRTTAHPVLESGKVVRVIGNIVDITERKQAEEALREQRDFSESLIETAQAIILVLDTQGRIVRFNPYMEQLVGYRLDEVKGLDWLETFIKLENNDATKSVFIKTVDNIQTSGTVNSIITKDGRSVLVEWSNKTLKDKDGRTVGVLAIGQDITERKKAELQLVRDNILLKTQQEASPDGILIVDENDNIISFNQRFCKIWEIPDHIMAEQSAEKAMQYVLPLLINPDEFIKRIRDLNKNKKSSSFEEIALTNGKILARHSAPMFGSDAQYYGRVWFYRDITERKRMEEVLAQKSKLLEKSQALAKLGSWEWDIVHDSWCFSDQWKKLHGVSDNDLTTSKLFEIAHPEDAPYIEKAFTDAKEQGKTYDIEHRIIRADNSETRYIKALGEVEFDQDTGRPVRMVGASQDITERNQAQLALEQKNQELEQFVYSVSHDLKNPLVTVKTFAGMLRQDLLNADQPQINEDLNYIDKAADKMQMLLDALLQYSRIGRIDTPAQTVSVDQQVQNCLAALAGILQQHEVQIFTGDLPHQLHGDLLHFGQIWQNLIENSVKYRGDQAHPHIEIGATQQGPEVVFYVRDNGMGIAPEHRERIFNLFSQLQAGSDGSGLGLALVKKTVTIYHGRIWVESAGEGQGSCFMFTLPGALIKGDKTT